MEYKNYLRLADLSQIEVDLAAVERIPEETAVRYRMLAIRQKGDTLTVLAGDPSNVYGIEEIRQITGMPVEIMLCEPRMLDNAIRYYYAEVQVRKAVAVANSSRPDASPDYLLMDDGEETPVVNLLNSLIHRACLNNASDIHVEPFEEKTVIRMRLDGAVLPFVTLQKNLHPELIARIKVLGDMDIAERRLPQDGHFRMKLEGQMVNMRVSIMPTVFGEKAVIRLLSGYKNIDYADSFGMRKADYEKMEQMLAVPNGLIYFTGPTGSGKTTTLYMILEELAKRPVNISTIEDPVELNLPGVNQCQVNRMAGMTFETGLRALLRQDPDIIMVGETRDAETAAISVRAAITGHLVLSTLHTNDAVSAIVRLEDMGVEPYLVANAVAGVVAQRLMRKLCPDCAVEIQADDQICTCLGIRVEKIRAAGGCVNCNHTGYRGRVAIHEILYIDKTIRRMITERESIDKIKEYARKEQRMTTLRDSGARLVAEGITTMEEWMKAACYE